jgi:membrane protein
VTTEGETAQLGVWRQARRGAWVAWHATGRGVVEFYSSQNLTFAASIAYYALLSLFPFVLMVLTVISRLALGRAGDERALVNLVERALPSDFDFLSTQVVQLVRAPVPLTIAGVVVTVWASMGVFGAITSAVNHAWGADQPYSYFKHKLIAFVMMGAAALVFGVALLVTGAVRFSERAWFISAASWLPWLPVVTGILSRIALLPAVIVAFGLIYYFAPNTRVRLRDVWFGAALAGVLWRLALGAFSWYLDNFGRFSVHGSVGTVVAFLVWVFLSAVILLYGVEVTACYARERQAGPPLPSGQPPR